MAPNSLNPVLFTVFGDPVTLAKCLASAGLLLDVVGVAILLIQELRTRMEEAEDASLENEVRADTQRWMDGSPLHSRPVRRGGSLISAEAARRFRVAAQLRGTRAGIALILVGFVLQLLGTLAA